MSSFLYYLLCLATSCLEMLERYQGLLHLWRMVARLLRGVDPFVGLY